MTESPNNSTSFSILEGSTCELPCWNNIVPAGTSEKEFLDVITKLKYVDQESIGEINISSKNYDKVVSLLIGPSKNQGSAVEVHVYIKNNTVIAINFLGETGLSVGYLILTTGEPQYLLSMTLPGNYNVTTLLNESQGLAYEHASYQGAIKLNENSSITGLFLYPSNLYNELMDEGFFSMGLYNRNESLSIMYPWDGYGNIAEKYPPRQP